MADAILEIRTVIIRHHVDDIGVGFQRLKAVRETCRDIQGIVPLTVQFECRMLRERR